MYLSRAQSQIAYFPTISKPLSQSNHPSTKGEGGGPISIYLLAGSMYMYMAIGVDRFHMANQ